MAFTIRTLSKHAEENLNKILKVSFINSKTKAIELALERYPELDKKTEQIYQLQKENEALRNQLNDIKNTFKVLQNLTED